MITNHGWRRSNFQSCLIILFKCPVFFKKYVMQRKGNVCAIHKVTKSQSIEIILEEAQALDLFDKDFTSVTINAFKELKQIMRKGIKERAKIISH